MVENYFSIFKRGIIDGYHHVREAHLHRYCAEFDFRYNSRKITDAERAEDALTGARGKRLTYRRPDQAAHAKAEGFCFCVLASESLAFAGDLTGFFCGEVLIIRLRRSSPASWSSS